MSCDMVCRVGREGGLHRIRAARCDTRCGSCTVGPSALEFRAVIVLLVLIQELAAGGEVTSEDMKGRVV